MFGVTVALIAFLAVGITGKEDSLHSYKELKGKVGVRFLVTVNDTWDENGCIATVATPMLISGVKYNQSDAFSVGTCDHGPLWFNVKSANSTRGQAAKMEVDLTFFSSSVLDAAHPTCSLPWNGTYLVPMTTNPRESLLPGCFVMDSREGDHMTYFWFHILEWKFN